MNELIFFTIVIGKFFCSIAAVGMTALAAVRLLQQEFIPSAATALLALILMFLSA